MMRQRTTMDVLPLHVVDRVCLFLHDVRDVSALRKTCQRLRWAGFSPECKWHWRLSREQSLALLRSPLRDRILQPGTAVHTLDLSRSKLTNPNGFEHVHTVDLSHSTMEIPESLPIQISEGIRPRFVERMCVTSTRLICKNSTSCTMPYFDGVIHC